MGCVALNRLYMHAPFHCFRGASSAAGPCVGAWAGASGASPSSTAGLGIVQGLGLGLGPGLGLGLLLPPWLLLPQLGLCRGFGFFFLSWGLCRGAGLGFRWGEGWDCALDLGLGRCGYLWFLLGWRGFWCGLGSCASASGGISCFFSGAASVYHALLSKVAQIHGGNRPSTHF